MFFLSISIFIPIFVSQKTQDYETNNHCRAMCN